MGETTVNLCEEFGRKGKWKSPLDLDFPLWDPNGKVQKTSVSKNDELYIKNEEFRIKNDELCSTRVGRSPCG